MSTTDNHRSRAIDDPVRRVREQVAAVADEAVALHGTDVAKVMAHISAALGQTGTREREELSRIIQFGAALGEAADMGVHGGHQARTLLGFLRRRREARERVDRDARDLLKFMGDGAYDEARNRARQHRGRGKSREGVHWSRVAVAIAGQTRRTIGQTSADRYAADASSARREGLSREMREGLVEIAAAIADLVHGRANATTAHNACARARYLADVAKRPGAAEAAAAVCQALDRLQGAGERCSADLANGLQPEPAEAAGKALQSLKAALLPEA